MRTTIPSHPGTKHVTRNNTIIFEFENGDIGVRLHNTTVARLHTNGDVTLNSGRWLTVTTKRRMNEVLKDTPYRVWQEKGEWVVYWRGKPFCDFFDGITLLNAFAPEVLST